MKSITAFLLLHFYSGRAFEVADLLWFCLRIPRIGILKNDASISPAKADLNPSIQKCRNHLDDLPHVKPAPF